MELEKKSPNLMELIQKYPKSIQWTFLLLVFFGLCFAIDIPEGYEFAKAGTEFIDKDKLDQTKYSVFCRLPAFTAWLPGWINDSVYFLQNITFTTAKDIDNPEYYSTHERQKLFQIKKL